MDTHNKGNTGEDMAAGFLLGEGHEIICRNYRLKDAEIDIISKEKVENNIFGIKEYIVFTEVKFRKTNHQGQPSEAVGLSKQRKIGKAALHFLLSNGYSTDTAVRFDVISIYDCRIQWIKNAYEFVF